LDKKTKKTISRILKVNHAGEYGAIRIYAAQLFISKFFYKDLLDFLSTTLSHEIEHCKNFIDAMPTRNSRPCRLMWLWGLGGYMLGFITALLGRNVIMICTAAVEKTVHKHLEEQIFFLEQKDEDLKQLIIKIQKQENEHLEYAEKNIKPSILIKPIYWLISVSTYIVIWLSTQGDVSKMRKAIKVNKNAK
jgi:ubiquinone biosynthesis monooxygenase Coq7